MMDVSREGCLNIEMANIESTSLGFPFVFTRLMIVGHKMDTVYLSFPFCAIAPTEQMIYFEAIVNIALLSMTDPRTLHIGNCDGMLTTAFSLI